MDRQIQKRQLRLVAQCGGDCFRDYRLAVGRVVGAHAQVFEPGDVGQVGNAGGGRKAFDEIGKRLAVEGH